MKVEKTLSAIVITLFIILVGCGKTKIISHTSDKHPEQTSTAGQSEEMRSQGEKELEGVVLEGAESGENENLHGNQTEIFPDETDDSLMIAVPPQPTHSDRNQTNKKLKDDLPNRVHFKNYVTKNFQKKALPKNSEIYKFLTRSQINEQRRLWPSFKVECEDQNSCPGYVGAWRAIDAQVDSITRKYYANSKMCSLTLWDQQTVLLNEHCLPNFLKTKGISCDGFAQIYFPKVDNFHGQSYPRERVGCDSIITFSTEAKIYNHRSDWAFVRLKRKLNRPLPALTKRGIFQHSHFKFYPVVAQNTPQLIDTSKVYTFGVIPEVRCSSLFTDSLSYKNYSSNFSLTFPLRKCSRKVIGGFSGSGVFNQTGRLAGVLNSTHLMEVPGTGKFIPSEGGRRGLANNLLCIKPIVKKRNPDCEVIKNGSVYIAHHIIRNLARRVISSSSSQSQLIEIKQSMEKSPERFDKIRWFRNKGKKSYFFAHLTRVLNNFADEDKKGFHRRKLQKKISQSVFPIVPGCVEPGLDEEFIQEVFYRSWSLRFAYSVLTKEQSLAKAPVTSLRTIPLIAKRSDDGSFYTLKNFTEVSSEQSRVLQQMNWSFEDLDKETSSFKGKFLTNEILFKVPVCQ